jgi:3'-phosphoadenosine 5'-phosphosulfate sulfotransferase (PAPS reductase)/FAD synthetase
MLKHIIAAHSGVLPADVKVVFANTGRERPETLDFVQECSERWRCAITWVEFDPEAEHKTKIVNHNSASRNGEPLKAAIDSRPTAHLFNVVSRYCTGTTKHRRIEKFGKKWCGWNSWISVRGIRADEPRRVASQLGKTGKDGQIIDLPLAKAGVTNDDVLKWWDQQPFQLLLPIVNGATLHGNCDLCPMKSRKKLLQCLKEDPSSADWWIEQERNMTARIADIPRRDNGRELRDRFFKTGESYRDLLDLALSPSVQIDIFGDDHASIDCACTD